MKTIAIRIGITMAVLGSLTFTACQTTGSRDGETTSGHHLVKAAKSSHSQVMAQKHKAKKTTTAPKPIPRAVGGGNASVAPPPINDHATLETWEIADVDLDGGGSLESGVALYDSSSETLYVWWSDTVDLGGNGTEETFDGFFWINSASVGLILDLKDHGEDDILACVATEDGFSGLICRDVEGNHEVMPLDANYKR
jgi:hypothetical protein